jgi:hypothetical protein
VLLFVVSYVIAVGLSNNEFRYRLQILGITAPFAGYALATRGAFWPVREGGRWRSGAAIALGGSILFAAVSLPLVVPGFLGAVEARFLEWGSIGAENQGQRAAGLENAAQVDRVYSAPWREAGESREAAGQPELAIEDYQAALALEAGDWRAAALLSDLFRREGNERKAAQVAANVPPTFNDIMLDWAWTRFTQPPETVDVGGADTGWVRGSHLGEEAEGETAFTYRWSTGEAAIKLRAGGSSERLTVRARALPGAGGEPLQVRWRAAGQDVATVAMDGEWREYTLEIPPNAAAGATLVLELSARARRPSADDRRELAVAIDYVRAEP